MKGFAAKAASLLQTTLTAGALTVLIVGWPGVGRLSAAVQGKDFSIRPIDGVSGTPAPILVTMPFRSAAESGLLLLRGLPDGVSLSSGFAFKGAWAVSVKELDALALLSRPDFDGQFVMMAELVKGDSTVSERQSVAVSFHKAAAEPAQNAPQNAPLELEAVQMKRAEAMLHGGDVAAARLLFEYLAKRGSARAALALAGTYDPERLQAAPTSGLRPDVEKAKAWYRRAMELGDAGASRRLNAMETAGR